MIRSGPSTADARAATRPSSEPLPATPTLHFSAELRRKARDQPGVGENVFSMPDGFPYPPIQVVKGSSALRRVAFGMTCERDYVALLAVTGQPAEVFAEYAAQKLDDPNPIRHARVDGARLTSVSDGYWTMSTIQRDDDSRPLLKLDWCG